MSVKAVKLLSKGQISVGFVFLVPALVRRLHSTGRLGVVETNEENTDT